jgi:hypothetical protein
VFPDVPTDALPSRDEVLAFLSGAPAPNGVKPPARVTKRDVARAFGVKGAARTELKLLIKALETAPSRAAARFCDARAPCRRRWSPTSSSETAMAN